MSINASDRSPKERHGQVTCSKEITAKSSWRQKWVKMFLRLERKDGRVLAKGGTEARQQIPSYGEKMRFL